MSLRAIRRVLRYLVGGSVPTIVSLALMETEQPGLTSAYVWSGLMMWLLLLALWVAIEALVRHRDDLIAAMPRAEAIVAWTLRQLEEQQQLNAVEGVARIADWRR